MEQQQPDALALLAETALHHGINPGTDALARAHARGLAAKGQDRDQAHRPCSPWPPPNVDTWAWCSWRDREAQNRSHGVAGFSSAPPPVTVVA